MTLPAVAPISLQDIATELRRLPGEGVALNTDDVKRLLGISRLHPGPNSLSDLLGKTRPWWGLVPVKYQAFSGTTYYDWNQSDGGLADAADPYFGNVPITAIQSSSNAAESGSVLNFQSDPGFRNNIKAQLLDSNYNVVREVVLTYNAPAVFQWKSVTLGGGDTSTCLFVAAGIFFVNLIKL
jgi:hypothetical protein